MIAYLDKYDTTVEVPDDASDKDIQDINQNFHSYVDTKPEATTPQEQPAPAAQEPQKYQPNF